MQYMHHLKQSDQSRPWVIIAGTLALLIAACILIPGMSEYSLWYDEVQVFRAADQLQTFQDFYQFADFPARIVHPPFFFALLKVWMALVGQTDVVLRTLTTFFGILSAALIYRVTVDLSRQPAAGLAAAIVFSSMGFASYYIHETHNYSLLMMQSAALLLFYCRWQDRPRHRYAIGIVVTELMLIYTNYAAVYLLLAFNLHALLVGFRRIRPWILLQIIVVLGYLPWLPALYWIITAGYPATEKSGVLATSMVTNWSAVPSLMQSLLYDGWPYYAAILILGLLASMIWPIQLQRQSMRAVGLLFLVAGASILFALIGNTVVQTLTPRRMIYLLVLVAVLLGYGFAHLPRRLRWLILAVFLVLTPNLPLPPVMAGNWFHRDAIEDVAAHAQPGDAVYINISGGLETTPLRHYAELLLRPKGIPFQTADDPAEDKLVTYLPRERIWIIERQNKSKNIVWSNAALDQKALAKGESHTTPRYKISLFSTPGTRPGKPLTYDNPAKVMLPQTFGGQFELTRIEVSQLEAAPGDSITVNLEWKVLHPTQQDWSIFLHLIEDDLSTLHGQGDSAFTHLGATLSLPDWLVGAPIYDQRTLTVDSDTPAGIYNLRVGIYALDRGQRLSVTPETDDKPDDGVIIAQIHVG
jgi:4-amino-4-deoxy-L-arabinose transferase-like glycosyltransferase